MRRRRRRLSCVARRSPCLQSRRWLAGASRASLRRVLAPRVRRWLDEGRVVLATESFEVVALAAGRLIDASSSVDSDVTTAFGEDGAARSGPLAALLHGCLHALPMCSRRRQNKRRRRRSPPQQAALRHRDARALDCRVVRSTRVCTRGDRRSRQMAAVGEGARARARAARRLAHSKRVFAV